MSSSATRLVATVSGDVQGVGFRWFVRREALLLGLEGWVANRSDGSVEVVAEGPDKLLARLVIRLWEGPASSSVHDVVVRHEPARGNLAGFAIRSGAHPGD